WCRRCSGGGSGEAAGYVEDMMVHVDGSDRSDN
nr:hypothetical protein [Tanacetum cinerariifolium]